MVSVVATHVQAHAQPLAHLHIYAGTIVETVIVEPSQVTILVEIADACEVVHTVAGTANVHAVLLCEACFPVLIEQVVVQVLHSFKLISLEQSRLMIKSGVGRVGCRDGIV